jgi:hypothetical protein
MNKGMVLLKSLILFSLLLFSACRQEEASEPTRISQMKFIENSKTINVGETMTVALDISPQEARNSQQVVYSVSDNEIIEIDRENSSNSGVVFVAKKPGNTVILAKADKLVDYCNITVNGTTYNTIPYISQSSNVVDMQIGIRKNVTVNLQGGTPVDNSGFVWNNLNPEIFNITNANNVGVIEGLRQGSGIVQVSHPKAQHSINIVVFVVGVNETARYITTEQNVITLYKNGDATDMYVQVVGGKEADINKFVYELIDGLGIIQISGTGDICRITPIEAGIARVRISNSSVEYPFEIQVIVKDKRDSTYIDIDNNFIIIDGSESKTIQTHFVGDVPSDADEKYTFSVDKSGHINVMQVGGLFNITGISAGTVLLKIDNEYSDFPRDVLIIVQNQMANTTNNAKYITTTQNVIQMEVGGSDAILKMKLIGGIEADRNNFSWVVDDSTVVETTTSHGSVSYLRGAITPLDESVFEAQAIIKAKKVGTATITLSNPKSNTTCQVLVKVYPRGTFGNNALVLSGPGIVKIISGETASLQLQIVSGTASSLGQITWEIENENIASVIGSGLNGEIAGTGSGITKLTVSGEYLKDSFQCIIVSGSSVEIDSYKYIYVDNPFKRMSVGQTIAIKIEHDNIPSRDVSFTVLTSDDAVLYVRLENDLLLVQGLKTGTSNITINGSGVLNTITIFIIVESEKITIDQPYSITGDNFIGIVKGQNRTISVNLIGANEAEKQNIYWTVEDESIISLNKNSNEANVTALRGGQTNVKVYHKKSINEKQIIVYVVNNENELYSKIVLGIERENYLLSSGENIFVKVLTNATDLKKREIAWNVDDISVVEVNSNADSAIISALSPGNAKITITHKDNIIPLVLYVSVIDSYSYKKEIGLPAIIEIAKNDNKNIKANVSGLNSLEVIGITWSVEDESVVTISGNGSDAYIFGKSEGQTFITVRQNEIGFEKRILIVCAASYQEFENLYVFSLDKTYHRIRKGDEITLGLVFGSAGFPEKDIQNISWSTGSGSIIQMNGSGKTAKIIGKNEGIATITISSPIVQKSITVLVEVYDTNTGTSEYRFIYESTKGIRRGISVDIPISIYFEENYVENTNSSISIEGGYSYIEVENENSSIASGVMFGNILRVSGTSLGNTYITLRHPKIKNDARILIYVRNTDDELEETFVIGTEKSHYLIDINEEINISLIVNTDEASKLNLIRWEVTNTDIITLTQIDRKNGKVKGKASGNSFINIYNNNEYVDCINISVRTSSSNNQEIIITTESIIGIVKGSSYRTRVNTNLGSGVEGALKWETQNRNIAAVGGFGASAVIDGKDIGETFISVRYNTETRYILVYVCETKTQVDNYYAMNIDRQYYRIAKGETLNLSMYFAPKKAAMITAWNDVYQNNTITITPNNKKATIFGKNEGIAKIEVANSQCLTPINLFIEVSNERSGSVVDNNKLVYLTTNNNYVIVEDGDRDIDVSVDIIGEYEGNENHFSWKVNNSNISVASNGRYATINPLVRSGESVITISNPYCNNIVLINVLIGSKYSVKNPTDPYIYVSKNIYNVNINESAQTIEYEIRNIPSVNYNQAVITSVESSVRYNVSGNKIVVTPVSIGKSEIIIRYPGVVNEQRIYFIVSGEYGNDAVYLTTSMNYVILAKNQLKMVDVNLVGYSEYNASNITWRVENSNIAYVVGNGTTVQVYGVQEGSTNIFVHHDRAQVDLRIIVKVVREGINENPVYLTTNENVIETVVSSQNNTITVTKIGGTNTEFACTWTVDDPSIVSVMGSGLSAYYIAKKEGIAKITITNREAGSLDIVIIVRKPVTGNLYISTQTPTIYVQPNTTSNRIEVTLEGGSESDNNSFSWSIYNQNPSDVAVAKNGGSVISISGAGNQCSFNALNAGTAKIRVQHPKANQILNIIVYVTRFNEIGFSEASKEIYANQSDFVNVNIPNFENFAGKVVYTVDSPGICTVMGTNEVLLLTGHAAGSTIVKAKISGSDTIAQLFVTVKEEADIDDVQIITAKTVLNMNPRSQALKVTASIVGDGFRDDDNDNLQWSIAGGDTNIISMFPASGKGREIQIIPNSMIDYISPLSTTLVITHPYTSKKKVIYVQVAELTNAFMLNKSEIEIESSIMTELTCNIIGGKSKDYEEVFWLSSRDENDPTKEVVKVMGSGRNVQLYGIADGVTRVVAMYKSLIATCIVTVKSAKYFEIEAQALKMYPGERDKNGNLLQIKYQVRPDDTNIVWVSTDASSADPVVAYEILPPPTKAILLDPKREGQMSITGIAHGRRSTLNLTVSYNFSLRGELALTVKPSDGPKPVSYTTWPPTAPIKLQNLNELAAKGISVNILPPDENGRGIIMIDTSSELMTYTNLVFEQYRPDSSTTTGKSFTLQLASKYSENEDLLIPVLVRGEGYWTNGGPQSSYNGYMIKSTSTIGGKYAEKINGSGLDYKLEIGDGENHYIIFDQQHADSLISNIRIENASSVNQRGVQFEVVEFEGRPAIRIFGGKDYIEYDRVGSNYNFSFNLSSTKPNVGGGVTYKIVPQDAVAVNDYNFTNFYETKRFTGYYNAVSGDDGDSSHSLHILTDNAFSEIVTIDGKKVGVIKSDFALNKNGYTTTDGVTVKSRSYGSRSKDYSYTQENYGATVDLRYGYGSYTYTLISPYLLGVKEEGYNFGSVSDTTYSPLTGEYSGGDIRIYESRFLDTETGGNNRQSAGYRAYKRLSSGSEIEFAQYENKASIKMFYLYSFDRNQDGWFKNIYTRKFIRTGIWNPNTKKSETDWDGFMVLENPIETNKDQTNLTIGAPTHNRRSSSQGYFVVPESRFKNFPLGVTLKTTSGDLATTFSIFDHTTLKINDSYEPAGEKYIYFPMPSISTNTKQSPEGALTINYKIPGDYEAKEITLIIKYTQKVRPSHMLYSGGSIEYRKAETWDETKMASDPFGKIVGQIRIDRDY